MIYISMRFHSARIKTSLRGMGACIDFSNADTVDLVPYTVLANALRTMCGDIPVPSKRINNAVRRGIVKKNELYDYIAKNSYIRYDTRINFSTYGNNKIIPNIYEFEKGSKHQLNSNSAIQTVICGKTKAGHYTWNYLYRDMHDKSHFDSIVNLINSTIREWLDKNGYASATDLPFNDVYEKALRFHLLDETYKAGIGRIFDEINRLKKGKLSSWMQLLWESNTFTPNTQYTMRVPVLNVSSRNYSVVLNGDIICPIDEDDEVLNRDGFLSMFLERIKEHSGISSFMNGGYIEVIGLEKREPIPKFRSRYDKILKDDSNASQCLSIGCE